MNIRFSAAVLIAAAHFFCFESSQNLSAITLIGDPFSSAYVGWTNPFSTPPRLADWRLNLVAPTLMNTNNAFSGPGSGVVNTGAYQPDVLFQNNFSAPGTYNLTATMRTNDDDIIGLVWNYQDPDNYFRVGVRSQGTAGTFAGTSGLAVQKVVDGVVTQISPNGTGPGVASSITQSMINNRTAFDLTVAVNGSNWSVLFNGTTVVSGTDADLASGGKVGFQSWSQLSDTDETPDPLYWGSEFESIRVTQGANTLYSETFNARPVSWRQAIMTNATGTATTANNIASKEPLGNFGRTINAPWIQQASNGNIDATVNNTDFIGPAVVVTNSGATSLGDYKMKIRIGSGDNDGLGVLVRAQDDNNFYRINFANEATGAGVTRAPKGMSVQKVVGGVWTELYRELPGSEQFIYKDNNAIFPLLPNSAGFEMFDLSVTAIGNTLAIQVIDHLGNIINYPVITDNTNPLLTGSVGLTTWGSTNVFYTNYGGAAGVPLVMAVQEPFHWDNPVGGNFHVSQNWSSSVIPTANDPAVFSLNSAGYTVTSSQDITVSTLTVTTDDVTLNLGSKILNVANTSFQPLRIADQNGDVGTLRLTSGTIKTNSLGVASVGGAATTTGVLEISGASAKVEILSSTHESIVGNGFTDDGLVIISAGGKLSSPVLLLGRNGGSGKVQVSGNGSLLDVNALYVGLIGHGELEVSDGGVVHASGLIVASQDVHPTGSLTIGPGGLVDIGSVTIGRSGEGSFNVQGGEFQVNWMQMGNDIGSIGKGDVSGSNSVLDVGDLFVGVNGNGELKVTNGGLVQVDYLGIANPNLDPNIHAMGSVTVGADSTLVSNGLVLVGAFGFGEGSLTVDGGYVDVHSQIQVGVYESAIGSLEICNGGVLYSIPFSETNNVSGTIGVVDATAHGFVRVTNPGSQWIQTGSFSVGSTGSGDLKIDDQGYVECVDAQVARLTTASADVLIAGAGSQWRVQNRLMVGGAFLAEGGEATVQVTTNGRISVGQRLHIWSQGEIDLTGGGIIEVGTVVAPASAGTLKVGTDGTLSGNGSILANVLVDGGTLAPGASVGTLSIIGDFTQLGSGALAIEIAGTGVGQVGKLDITGSLQLGGMLQVSLFSFTPAIGDNFNLFDWTGTLSGTFGTLNLPPLPSGRIWETSQLYTAGVLSVVAGQAGDFDGDGDVDGADFIVWQTNFPAVGGHARSTGDADGDTDVDGADFEVWMTNFPHAPGSGSSPVPEPQASLIAVIGAIGILKGCRVRTTWHRASPI